MGDIIMGVLIAPIYIGCRLVELFLTELNGWQKTLCIYTLSHVALDIVSLTSYLQQHLSWH